MTKKINTVLLSLILVVVTTASLLFGYTKLYRFDQIEKDGDELLVKTNLLTGVTYEYTDKGWQSYAQKIEYQISDLEQKKNIISANLSIAQDYINNPELHQFEIDYYNSYTVPVDQKPSGTLQTFDQFLDEIKFSEFKVINNEHFLYHKVDGDSFEIAIKEITDSYVSFIQEIDKEIMTLSTEK